MKLIIGLGNPGLRYALTRHNAGFLTLDLLAEQLKAGFNKRRGFALYAQKGRGEERLFLLKPQSFMNLSGRPVRELLKFYKIDLKDLLVIHDDMDLPLGQIRLRRSGSSGGHKGMESIIQQLGSDRLDRLKIGIGHPAPGQVIDYVLEPFSREELPLLEETLYRAKEAALTWLEEGITLAMNKYN
ncbi:MAG: aminoacyl-tRNA hydrolase [Clostridiales bacterium]|jgi:PTH1 family peptidyl-tRNA hydrolase|nr:aminoacyl-tRNA hydrolase [Clostridiales bacterium]